jgi:hypothetical protein
MIRTASLLAVPTTLPEQPSKYSAQHGLQRAIANLGPSANKGSPRCEYWR